MSVAKPLLSVRGLTVTFGSFTAVKDVSFDLHPGETLAVVGESGSGKSVTALSVMRLIELGTRGEITAGQILLDVDPFDDATEPVDLVATSEDELRSIRGRTISMIFQEPLTALNPVYSIGNQITEAIRAHRDIGRKEAMDLALDIMERVRIPEAAKRLKQYPHEMSGGMRQRVMIAQALVLNPRILICDEPTTALDVTIQAQILGLIRDLQDDTGAAVIMITHDNGCRRRDRRSGGGHEELAGGRAGNGRADLRRAEASLHPSVVGRRAPARQHERRRRARQVRADRRGTMTGSQSGDGVAGATETAAGGASGVAVDEAEPLIECIDLYKRFPVGEGSLVHAVVGVNLTVGRGETLAVVGESGCGKSTLANTIIRLEEPSSGQVILDGADISTLRPKAMRAHRRKMQIIFQDPFASLNPRHQVGLAVAEPLRIHGMASGNTEEIVADLFDKVDIPRSAMRNYPHQFSGGQRQRICIARALALQPELVIADEAVSALDVSIQAQVINLMMDLQQEMGLSYLFISHDLAVVERVAHRVAVMYLGQIVELGTRRQVFTNPSHPYTRKLLEAVPIADPTQRRHRERIEGEIPSPVWPPGESPELVTLVEAEPGHFVAESDET